MMQTFAALTQLWWDRPRDQALHRHGGHRASFHLQTTVNHQVPPQQQQRVELFPRQVRGQNAALLKAGRGSWTPPLRRLQCLRTADDAPAGGLWRAQQNQAESLSDASRTVENRSSRPVSLLLVCPPVRACARAAYLVPSRPCRPSCPAASRPAEPSLRCSRTKQFSRTVLDGSAGRDERSPTGPPRRLASWSWSEGGGRTVDPDCCSVRPSPPEPSGTGRQPNARASSGSACVSAPHVYSLKTGPNKQRHNQQPAER